MPSLGFFGPAEGIDTHDYAFLMQGNNIIDRPQSLIGHTLTNANVNLSDALQVTRVRFRRGRIETYTLTKRAAEERSRSYTIGFPSGALWTPALQMATRQGCRKTFFMKYLCPADRRYEHVNILPDGVLSPPVPEGDVITVDDTTLITSSSTLETPKQETLFRLGYNKIYTLAAKSFSAVRFTTDDCPTCADVPGLGLIAVGGNGTLAPVNLVTEDRFSTVVLPVAGLATHYGTCVFTDGALVVIGYSDKTSPAGPALAGSLGVSNNGGASITMVAGITVPIFGVDRIGETLVAVGGTGAGAAKVYFSTTQGASWTEFLGTGLPATDAFTGIAGDPDNANGYIVAESGKVFKITAPGNTLALVDLSTSIPTFTGIFNAVKVLGPGHVMMGGATGYLIESVDSGAHWLTRSLSGATPISAIGGNRFRTLVAAGSSVWERSPLSDFDFVLLTLEGGATISGTIRDITINVDGDYNLVALVSDDGTAYMGTGFYPNA